MKRSDHYQVGIVTDENGLVRCAHCLSVIEQNPVERARDVYWCAHCPDGSGCYVDGSAGFPAGDPIRIRLEDARKEARKIKGFQGTKTQESPNGGLAPQEVT